MKTGGIKDAVSQLQGCVNTGCRALQGSRRVTVLRLDLTSGCVVSEILARYPRNQREAVSNIPLEIIDITENMHSTTHIKIIPFYSLLIVFALY